MQTNSKKNNNIQKSAAKVESKQIPLTKTNVPPSAARSVNKMMQVQLPPKQFHPNSPASKLQKSQKRMKIQIHPQQYTSFNVKYLGNHSSWKKVTFQNRYNDPRLLLLNPDHFLGKYVLDIGCNEGFVDIQIAMRFFPKKIYAVDIDYKMIKNAKKTLMNVASKDKNFKSIVEENDEVDNNGQYKKKLVQLVKVQGENQINEQICHKIQQLPLFFQNRLKKQFSLDFYLPENVKIFSQKIKPQNRFPMNIKFGAENVFTFSYQDDISQYDTILCLKVTKWIHLTFGDQGIRRLFQKIYDLLKFDGILILQAQDWPSYKRKKNMFQIYRQNYDKIKIGPNQFQKVLTDDPLKQFKFQLIQKIQPNQKNPQSKQKSKNPSIDYPIMIFKKMSTMLYY